MGLHDIDSVEVAARLRRAREAAGLTQTDAATTLRVARTTLVAIEQGRRRVRTAELQDLARLYGASVNALLRREAVHVDLVPRFRKFSTTNDESAERAAHLLTDLVRAEVELENLLGVTRTRNYPPARPLLPGDVRLQAENDATELRQWLGLGLSPVRDVMSLLELDLGVRVYLRQLDSQVSGLFAYDDSVGACILLNANHPQERQAQTAVHELGHLTSCRTTPDVCRWDRPDDSRAEKYANAFGRAILTPARTVMVRFHDVTAGASLPSPRSRERGCGSTATRRAPSSRRGRPRCCRWSRPRGSGSRCSASPRSASSRRCRDTPSRRSSARRAGAPGWPRAARTQRRWRPSRIASACWSARRPSRR